MTMRRRGMFFVFLLLRSDHHRRRRQEGREREREAAEVGMILLFRGAHPLIERGGERVVPGALTGTPLGHHHPPPAPNDLPATPSNFNLLLLLLFWRVFFSSSVAWNDYP